MLNYLLQNPDALALVLLLFLVGATMAVGLVAGRRRDRTEPPPADDEVVTTWPNLLRIEVLAGVVTLLAVTWWALLLDLPVGRLADPTVTPAMAKAPWFFVGVQEMLQYFDVWLAGAVLPLLMVIGLCVLPYLDVNPEGSGRYTLRDRPLAIAVVTGLVVMWLLPMVVGMFFRGEHWALQPAWRPPPLTQELPPPQMLSLASRLGLSGAGAHVVGASLCLGPFLAWGVAWRRLRNRGWIARMGFVRFLLIGVLLLSAVGVVVKVALVGALDIRYLWVTPWFRI